jgi:pyruvate/2-oxoglutarate dehydrogenase complex dihydrolipoamide dehydrogenase (E3) component
MVFRRLLTARPAAYWRFTYVNLERLEALLMRRERTGVATTLTPDLCVIGAGASGLAVAKAARRLGASVVLVERGEFGGSSLKSGSLALRALQAAAEKAVAVRSGAQFGLTGDDPRVNFRRLHDHIVEVLATAAPEAAPAALEAQGIELLRGTGHFTDPKTLAVGETLVTARRFVIATGARPHLPDVPGLLSVPYFTTETIFDNTRKLTHLVVIGAGPMGVEIALSYRRLGCDVTIVTGSRALGDADPELAAIALRRLTDEGVALFEGADILAVQARSQGIGIVVRTAQANTNLDASHILVAAQRTPNLADLGLEAAHMKLDRDGVYVKLNGALRTSNARVHAVGEAMHAGVPHDVFAEAELVVRAALLRQPVRFEASRTPRLALTDPEIAEVGLTEPMARARFKAAFTVVRAAYAGNDRARAERDGAGVVKLIVGRTGELLGAGIVGPSAGELSGLLSLAISRGLKLADLSDFAPPYPSYAGLLRELGQRAAENAPPSALEQRLLSLNRLLP